MSFASVIPQFVTERKWGTQPSGSAYIAPTPKVRRAQKLTSTTPTFAKRAVLSTSGGPTAQTGGDAEVDKRGVEWMGLGAEFQMLTAPRAAHTDVSPRRSLSWWIAQSSFLPVDRRNAWVVSWILEEYQKEDSVANACNMDVFAERMRLSGLGPLMDPGVAPRKRCRVIQEAQPQRQNLLDEYAQRSMIRAIQRSLAEGSVRYTGFTT